MTEEEIQKLINASKEGNDEAFGTLYDHFAKPVYKFIYVRVRHAETAEDLLSLTFLKAWKNLPRYAMRKNAKFSTWLFQISLNVTKDYWKKKKDVTIEDYMLEQSTPQESHHIDAKLAAEHVVRAIAALPENYKDVLTLRFVNELSVAETAEVMQKREGAVRTLQTRALKALKKHVT